MACHQSTRRCEKVLVQSRMIQDVVERRHPAVATGAIDMSNRLPMLPGSYADVLLTYALHWSIWDHVGSRAVHCQCSRNDERDSAAARSQSVNVKNRARLDCNRITQLPQSYLPSPAGTDLSSECPEARSSCHLPAPKSRLVSQTA